MGDDLLRIEFKLDLVLAALQQAGILLPTKHLPSMQGMGSAGDACPACGQQIRLQANYTDETVQRACGCVSPIRVVPGISSLTKEPEHARKVPSTQQLPPDEAT